MSYSITSYADSAPTTDTEIASYGERDYRGTPYIYAYHDGGYTPLHHLAKLVEESWTTSEGRVRCNARYVLPTEQEILSELGTEHVHIAVIYATTPPFAVGATWTSFIHEFNEVSNYDDHESIFGAWWSTVAVLLRYGVHERGINAISQIEGGLSYVNDAALELEEMFKDSMNDHASFLIKYVADHARAH